MLGNRGQTLTNLTLSLLLICTQALEAKQIFSLNHFCAQ